MGYYPIVFLHKICFVVEIDEPRIRLQVHCKAKKQSNLNNAPNNQ